MRVDSMMPSTGTVHVPPRDITKVPKTLDTEDMSRDQLVATIAAMEKKRIDRNAQVCETQRRRQLQDPSVLKQQYAKHAIYAKNRYHTDEVFRQTILERAKATKAKNGAMRAVRRLFAEC